MHRVQGDPSTVSCSTVSLRAWHHVQETTASARTHVKNLATSTSSSSASWFNGKDSGIDIVADYSKRATDRSVGATKTEALAPTKQLDAATVHTQRALPTSGSLMGTNHHTRVNNNAAPVATTTSIATCAVRRRGTPVKHRTCANPTPKYGGNGCATAARPSAHECTMQSTRSAAPVPSSAQYARAHATSVDHLADSTRVRAPSTCMRTHRRQVQPRPPCSRLPRWDPPSIQSIAPYNWYASAAFRHAETTATLRA